jgi:hypothetical protein
MKRWIATIRFPKKRRLYHIELAENEKEMAKKLKLFYPKGYKILDIDTKEHMEAKWGFNAKSADESKR